MNTKKNKERLDKLLVERGLVSTRARAQAMIIAGDILVNDQPVTKAGELIHEDAAIRLRNPELRYVSRGALKLKGALEQFSISASEKTAIDVGSSTGGFTEVLLENGARRVYAVDVGTNQLAWKLRSNPNVVVRENYNARHFRPEDFDEKFDLLVMDVSFISIRLILPSVKAGLTQGADLVVLFKPQFELGREWIGEGGIVTSQEQAKRVLEDTIEWSKSLGLQCRGWIDSPIQGTDGNREYLVHWVNE